MPTASRMARGTARVGRRDSSPKEPADSNPANARNPKVAARATVPTAVPAGSRRKSSDTVAPAGAVPAPSLAKMTPTSTRMSSTDTASNASSDRVLGRTPRAASSQMTAQPASAIGYQSAPGAQPVARRKACPNTATPAIDTGGNTRYVPSSAQEVTKPARGPRVLPTKA